VSASLLRQVGFTIPEKNGNKDDITKIDSISKTCDAVNHNLHWTNSWNVLPGFMSKSRRIKGNLGNMFGGGFVGSGPAYGFHWTKKAGLKEVLP